MPANINGPFAIDVALVRLDGPPPAGDADRELEAIRQLHELALRLAASPPDAYRLLVHAVADLGEMATNASDALTAAIGVLREWRDGDPEIDAALPEAVELLELTPPRGKR